MQYFVFDLKIFGNLRFSRLSYDKIKFISYNQKRRESWPFVGYRFGDINHHDRYPP
jgi:hypothetical protein